jgi:hypothetical protein
MSYAIFDCSQFLTFPYDCVEQQISKEDLVGFKNIGFNIFLNEEIRDKKRSFLRPYMVKQTVELLNQEFVGIFEDWKEISDPPNELKLLKNEIIQLSKKNEISKLKLIIISCASDDDVIIERSVHMNEFFEALFSLSKWNFNEAIENMVLSITV